MKDEVDYISGATRVFGIVGDPITQVRSPELVTAEFVRRQLNAIMIPVHAPTVDFETVLRGLMKMSNLGGLIFTIPFKTDAIRFVDVVGPHAKIVGSINAMTKLPDGRWCGEIFDGVGCIVGIRKAGLSLTNKRLQLIGAGGAGSAIGVAMAFEHPAQIRIFDPDNNRANLLAAKIKKVDGEIETLIGPPTVDGIDFIFNASPVGMLDDARSPIGNYTIPSSVVVFDAIVMPERTPLLEAAESFGCKTVRGREMMRGQIGRIVDFYENPGTFIDSGL